MTLHVCSVCKKSFSRKDSRERHELTVHHHRQMERCGICFKVMRKDNLRVHMKKIHKQDTSYATQQQGKKF